MAPTGQTVSAVLLALGLARGPSETPPAPRAPEGTAETESAPGPDAADPNTDPRGVDAAEGEPVNETPAAPTDPETSGEPPGTDDADAEPPHEALEPGAAEPGPSTTTAVPSEEAPTPAEPSHVEPSAEEPLEDEAWEDEAWEDEAWEDEAWEDDYDPLRDSPEAVAAQRRIAGGAVVVGLGAMVSFGGLAMALSDPCARPAGNSCSAGSRNRAALTMALPGLATVAVGSVMLALGIRQRNALRVDANLSAGGGGILLRGRF